MKKLLAITAAAAIIAMAGSAMAATANSFSFRNRRQCLLRYRRNPQLRAIEHVDRTSCGWDFIWGNRYVYEIGPIYRRC